MNPLKQMRAARMRALAEGTAAPVAFFWDDPELLTADGDTFELWFNDMVDDWFGISAAMIVEALMVADGRDVLVHLNSPGGMVTEGLAIHSTIKQYGGKVTMRVEGLAASAASFIMLAADEVLIEPNAMVMIHDAWDVTIGPASEHRKAADLLDKVSDNIAAMYATKSGIDADAWRAAMIEETWYVGQEAVDAGLVDSVTEDAAAPAEESTAAASARREWSSIFAGKRPATKQAGGIIRPDQLVAKLDEQAMTTTLVRPGTTVQPAALAANEPASLDWTALSAALRGVRP